MAYAGFVFLVFANAQAIENGVAAAYTSVRAAGARELGITDVLERPEYHSVEKLKGVIGVQMTPENVHPPLAHEVVHRWANFLDEDFGFGKDLDYDYGTHWGATSVFGQLGGFDASTLRCQNPAQASPPDCVPEANGRTRYVVGTYAGNTNSFQSVDYAPLELYLMGLIPKTEVQSSFLLLEDASVLPESYNDADPDHVIVEASGIREIAFSDIVARHGEVRPLSEAERHFKTAFVLVTREPAPDELLDRVVRWAEVFGNRISVPPLKSFEAATGGRATMDTRLGRRRRTDEPLVPPEPHVCSVTEQDCAPGFGCYHRNFQCRASRMMALGAACTYGNDCEPGSVCTGAVGGEKSCLAYCDPTASGAQSCDAMCELGAWVHDDYGICMPNE